jgi:hypothetical protein
MAGALSMASKTTTAASTRTMLAAVATVPSLNSVSPHRP